MSTANSENDPHQLSARARVCESLGELQEAGRCYEQLSVLYKESGDLLRAANAIGTLATVFLRLAKQGNDRNMYVNAITQCEEALILHRQCGDRRGEASDLGNIGAIYSQMRQWDKVVKYAEQQLQISREIGDRYGEGIASGNLGMAHLYMGQYDRGVALLEDAIQLGRLGDNLEMAREAEAVLGRLRDSTKE
jgi:tetratricopeptide (TPR) repeat protein